jgi:predicted choloylglycine hydrolase
MKTQILIPLLLLLIAGSCIKEKDNAIEKKNNMQESMFSIVLIDGQKSTYLTVENENDTLYLNKFIDSTEKSFRIKASQKLISEIRKNVLYHVQADCFFNKRNETLHGNKVSFHLQQYTNKLKAEYSSIGNYKDVSNKFDSLIIFLKNEDKRIKEFLSN